MYIYNGGRRNLKYFYSQIMAAAAAVVVVVHFTMFLLEQEGFFLLLDHISWINIEQRFLYFLNTFFGSMSSFERYTSIFRFYLNGSLSR